ncbi:MAG: DUF1351 domain-containing protein [Desulfovibrio sp.]|jgi:septum formation topological specificity factor MinE|nr:DUF1351 domain-containing protein [Desulfovibrio sp.]
MNELKLKETLPVLSFNFEQLKAWATDLAARYADLPVSEDALADVKRDMAELNKARKTVDDARKEAVRRVSEPIRVFEAQIKEVCAIFDAAYSRLGEQVKAFEDAQRDEKRKIVEGIIKEECDAAFGGGPGLHIPVQEKWLNKTTSLKSIREEVATIIQRHVEDEKRQAALEQARQDRAAAIENHVHTLNQKYELSLPVHRFMLRQYTDFTNPIDAVFADIRAVFEVEARKAAASPHIKPASAVQPSPKPEQLDPPAPATRVMSVVFEFSAENHDKITNCLKTLRGLCVNFAVRAK